MLDILEIYEKAQETSDFERIFWRDRRSRAVKEIDCRHAEIRFGDLLNSLLEFKSAFPGGIVP